MARELAGLRGECESDEQYQNHVAVVHRIVTRILSDPSSEANRETSTENEEGLAGLVAKRSGKDLLVSLGFTVGDTVVRFQATDDTIIALMESADMLEQQANGTAAPPSAPPPEQLRDPVDLSLAPRAFDDPVANDMAERPEAIAMALRMFISPDDPARRMALHMRDFFQRLSLGEREEQLRREPPAVSEHTLFIGGAIACIKRWEREVLDEGRPVGEILDEVAAKVPALDVRSIPVDSIRVVPLEPRPVASASGATSAISIAPPPSREDRFVRIVGAGVSCVTT